MTGPAPGEDIRNLMRAYADLITLSDPVRKRIWLASGLTLTQLRMLTYLRRGPLAAGQLGQAIGISASSATRVLDRLEERGLISRRRRHRDRRLVEITIEPLGSRLVEETPVLRGSAIHRAIEAMGGEDRRRILASLEAFIEAVRAAAKTESDSGSEAGIR